MPHNQASPNANGMLKMVPMISGQRFTKNLIIVAIQERIVAIVDSAETEHIESHLEV